MVLLELTRVRVPFSNGIECSTLAASLIDHRLANRCDIVVIGYESW